MDRRDLLKSAAGLSLAAGSGLLLPSREVFAAPYRGQSTDVVVDNSFWLKPRRLSIKRSDNNEFLDIVFFENGQYNELAYRKLCWIFRDVKSRNAARHMDIALFNLIYGVQEWGRSLGGYNPVYNLSSGYRTNSRNAEIEGAARNSFHVLGKGSDGTFTGVKLSSVIAMGNYFNAGGVGGYKTFAHFDTGGKDRRWGTAKRRT